MNNKEKVLAEIFSKPTYKFHIRELASLTKLNPNTIINIIKGLEKEKIIMINKKKHITEIFSNMESVKTLNEKRLFNLRQLCNSGIIEAIKKDYDPEAIVLMGSYSRGEDVERSDIDIVIITSKKKIMETEKFGKILRRKIQLMPLEYKDISEEFYTNLINGIVLYGYIKRK